MFRVSCFLRLGVGSCRSRKFAGGLRTVTFEERVGQEDGGVLQRRSRGQGGHFSIWRGWSFTTWRRITTGLGMMGGADLQLGVT